MRTFRLHTSWGERIERKSIKKKPPRPSVAIPWEALHPFGMEQELRSCQGDQGSVHGYPPGALVLSAGGRKGRGRRSRVTGVLGIGFESVLVFIQHHPHGRKRLPPHLTQKKKAHFQGREGFRIPTMGQPQVMIVEKMLGQLLNCGSSVTLKTVEWLQSQEQSNTFEREKVPEFTQHMEERQ